MAPEIALPPSPPPGAAVPLTAAALLAPPSSLFEGGLTAVLTGLGLLIAASAFSLLRSSIEISHPVRVVEPVRSARKRRRLGALLTRVQPLAASARLFKVALELLFTIVVLDSVGDLASSAWARVGIALAIAVPAIVLFVELLPMAFARKHGDQVLRTALIPFAYLQLPLRVVVVVIDFARRAVSRALGLPEETATTRAIVEELRVVVAESSKPGGLEEHERELIENVMEFHETDVAAVMTPRTEIYGIDVEEGIAGAIRKAAETGHSRIPVYQESLDTIIGTISARDLVQLAAEGRLETAELRSVLHPAYFVPETKRVQELLAEFRSEKLKIAIVLDEYGGTAGLVTLDDVLGEIVGGVHGELDEDEPSAVRELGDGIAEVDASLHVSEVNEELDLDLPEEEDFETLGGFVLAELGHMPKEGESFVRKGVTYSVVSASDRRVITVRVERPLERGALASAQSAS